MWRVGCGCWLRMRPTVSHIHRDTAATRRVQCGVRSVHVCSQPCPGSCVFPSLLCVQDAATATSEVWVVCCVYCMCNVQPTMPHAVQCGIWLYHKRQPLNTVRNKTGVRLVQATHTVPPLVNPTTGSEDRVAAGHGWVVTHSTSYALRHNPH